MVLRMSARWSNDDATTPCRQLGLGYRELRSWQRETVVHRGGSPYNLPSRLPSPVIPSFMDPYCFTDRRQTTLSTSFQQK